MDVDIFLLFLWGDNFFINNLFKLFLLSFSSPGQSRSAGISPLQDYDLFCVKNLGEVGEASVMAVEEPRHVKREAERFTGVSLCVLTLRLSCLRKFQVLFQEKGNREKR